MFVNLASKGKEYLEQRKAMKSQEATEEAAVPVPAQEEVMEVKEVDVVTNWYVCCQSGVVFSEESIDIIEKVITTNTANAALETPFANGLGIVIDDATNVTLPPARRQRETPRRLSGRLRAGLVGHDVPMHVAHRLPQHGDRLLALAAHSLHRLRERRDQSVRLRHVLRERLLLRKARVLLQLAFQLPDDLLQRRTRAHQLRHRLRRAVAGRLHPLDHRLPRVRLVHAPHRQPHQQVVGCHLLQPLDHRLRLLPLLLRLLARLLRLPPQRLHRRRRRRVALQLQQSLALRRHLLALLLEKVQLRARHAQLLLFAPQRTRHRLQPLQHLLGIRRRGVSRAQGVQLLLQLPEQLATGVHKRLLAGDGLRKRLHLSAAVELLEVRQRLRKRGERQRGPVSGQRGQLVVDGLQLR